jgi:hypothetical protein
MNARNLISKVPQNVGVTQGVILLAAKIILLVAVFCLVGQPALAKGPNNCDQMSKSAFKARKSEIKDDYFIAVGKCWNLPTKEETKDCIQDAKVDRQEDQEEAEDQLDARLEFCDKLGQDPYNPVLNPADFVNPAAITAGNANPYWPLVPGYMWTYKNRDASDTITETNTVEVLAGESIVIEGIECVVVHDIVYEGDTTDPDFIIEETFDWYGQQSDGTVWYLGEFSLSKEECDEETGELCGGLFGDDGSWQAGFDGGEGGVIMFADPSVEIGTVYRQELYLGEAEDGAEVINFNVESVTVPFGTFNTNVLKTYEFAVLEPGVTENKYYAPGVGLLKEEALEDDMSTGERVELESINFTP